MIGSKFAAAGFAVAFALLGAADAATHPQDLAALWKFKEEALKMSNNDARWRKVVSADPAIRAPSCHRPLAALGSLTP